VADRPGAAGARRNPARQGTARPASGRRADTTGSTGCSTPTAPSSTSIGYESLAALEAADGLDALFVEPVGQGSSTSDAGTAVTIAATPASANHAPLPPTEARLYTISWDDESALALDLLERACRAGAGANGGGGGGGGSRRSRGCDG